MKGVVSTGGLLGNPVPVGSLYCLLTDFVSVEELEEGDVEKLARAYGVPSTH